MMTWRALALVGMFLLAACSAEEPGSLSFRARFPSNVTFAKAAEWASQRFDTGRTITTVRLSALQSGRVVASRDFPAADRQGQLMSLDAGVYEVRVEGLTGELVVLRGVKKNIRVESAKVRDAGEFLLAPVSPQSPLLDQAPPAVTNVAELTLSGSKEMFTGLRVNGETVIPETDERTVFSIARTLTEGINDLQLATVNGEGVESSALRVRVTLDTKAPEAKFFDSR